MTSDPTGQPTGPRYYAAYDTDSIRGPLIVATCASHSQAIDVLASHAARDMTTLGRPIVLLDLGSIVAADEAAFKRLLNDDPVISMIFKMGVQIGREDEAWRHS